MAEKIVEKNKYKRIFLIVIDSLGVGFDPEAKKFDDEGANTISHIISNVESIKMPNLQNMGMANLIDNDKMKHVDKPIAYCMRLHEKSNAKSTMEGHWEMMGIETKVPFKTFTDTGFPPELIKKIEEVSGREVIGNKAASGTEIIKELGEEEIKNHKIIVYTSADSVLQICGHEETFDLKELYRVCEKVREITLAPEYRVGRIIARPYKGTNKDNFERTSNRHDYTLAPPTKTVLDILNDNGIDTIGVGKIGDIFSMHGIKESLHSDSSVEGMDQTIDILKNKNFTGFCFVNLVDFDAKWGHRRNVKGYAEEIERFDEKIKVFMDNMKEDDLLMITADHGNDPTWRGTDHTREYVPLLIYSKKLSDPKKLNDQESFAIIGNMVLKNFDIKTNDDLIKNEIVE